MFKRIILVTIFCSFAGIFSSLAQESVSSDSLLRDQNKDISPLSHDSIKLQQLPPIYLLPKIEIQGIESLLKQQSVDNNLNLKRNDSIVDLFFYNLPKFKSYTSFNLGASRWYMPVLGAVTTFSATLNYQATKDLSFHGGISLSQFHNLSYVQTLLAPGWPAKSNIISNGFVGASYRLHDRILLHGMYQRSLYNQLPGNLMIFAPGQNVVVTGASVDIWNGLGVTVDHVWEFDRYGNMRKGFRYSPYVDIQKFIKFLKQ